MVTRKWDRSVNDLHAFIEEESRNTLEAYKAQPNLVTEHANHEEDTARGGYFRSPIVRVGSKRSRLSFQS